MTRGLRLTEEEFAEKLAKLSPANKARKAGMRKAEPSIPMLPERSEHYRQSCFITWKRAHTAEHPELALCFAVPNGGKRDPITGKKLKDEGSEPGIPDVLLTVARGPYIGLALEFKVPGKKPGPVQRHMIELMRAEKWRVEVVTEWDQARDITLDYLGTV